MSQIIHLEQKNGDVLAALVKQLRVTDRASNEIVADIGEYDAIGKANGDQTNLVGTTDVHGYLVIYARYSAEDEETEFALVDQSSSGD